MKATSAYGLHSPYLYRLYREVLFARMPRRQRQHLGLRTKQDELLYKLNRSLPPESFVFMYHPHRQEERWQRLCAMPHATACIDLYHSGIVLFNPKLSKQHILLR